MDALSRRDPPIEFANGLTDEELANVEEQWGFVFPPDLRRFLQRALPVTAPFVDWREARPPQLKESMDAPADGIAFDVENNSFWMEEWGHQPSDPNAALRIARDKVALAPKLIPVYSHRYLPSEPAEEGNPVFSVMQSDIIYYGENLADWFQNEFWTSFGLTGPVTPKNVRRIRFWSDLAESQ